MTKQIAITGHWSQSIGDDLSGQQGMSAAIFVAAISAIDAPIAIPAFAGAESGANTRPAIKKIASSRPRWVEIFTALISHDPASMETSVGSLIRQNSEWMAHIVNQLVAAGCESVQCRVHRAPCRRHLNIINAHARTATRRNDAAAVRQNPRQQPRPRGYGGRLLSRNPRVSSWQPMMLRRQRPFGPP